MWYGFNNAVVAQTYKRLVGLLTGTPPPYCVWIQLTYYQIRKKPGAFDPRNIRAKFLRDRQK